MNKTAIKNFAVWARVVLIEAVKQRAYEYAITEGGANDPALASIGGRLLSATEREQRRALIGEVEKKGYAQAMEEAAYTWFNRFIALRFMEVNGYLPSRVRVFTNSDGEFRPEILKEAANVEIDGLDREKVIGLLDSQDNEGLYKYLIITQCNALGVGLPGMFGKIADRTELLFPANLLRDGSVIDRMVSDIPENDWRDAVQIIGWLYQYYNSELKDDTFAGLKKNIKISKERIPAATQLFTPDWIVRYMVENSLGRIYIGWQLSAEAGLTEAERAEKERGIAERMGWRYYLPEAEQTPEVRRQLESICTASENSLTALKFIDPCMGSGHILVYAFDVFMQIYTAEGWSDRDAAKSIVENNLFGLDIDGRAGQLSYFAVMMKARKHNRRALSGGAAGIIPNVYAICESNYISRSAADDFCGGNAAVRAEFEKLCGVMNDAKEYGSILSTKGIDFDLPLARCDGYADEVHLYMNEVNEDIVPLIKTARLLAQEYDVVCTNPPYMGSSGMSAKLAEFVKKNYPDSKADLFAVFIERCGQMAKKNGYQAMITQHAWMFLSSFESLRKKLLSVDIVNMAHLGARAFEEIGGEVVQTTSFVIRKSHVADYKGEYCRLIEPTTQQGKENMFLAGENRYAADQSNFSKIPGAPVAYWVSEAVINDFRHKSINSCFLAIVKGIFTGDNTRFLRLWYEVDSNELCKKWMPYSKGGEYRKWYGNLEYVINWEGDARELRNYSGSGLGASQYFGKETIVWTKLTSYKTGFRSNPKDVFFDDASPALIGQEGEKKNCFLALLNSAPVAYLLGLISPTLNFQCGEIKKIPIPQECTKNVDVATLSNNCIECAKLDWDSYESSWDFKRNPMTVNSVSAAFGAESGDKYATSLKAIYLAWKSECNERFMNLKSNEEALNRIFIDIYGLQDELTPEVADRDVTVHRVFDTKDDVPESMKGSAYVRTMRDEIVSLISYAVGCMFGRYSVDYDGLAYAGGEWDAGKYRTVIPEKDNIIPICDDEYFNNEMTALFVNFVRRVYGEDTLEANLKFIADALGGKGTPREVIRSYFLNDFYADHLKTYQKRPIYWLFDSGKKNGFKALIYLHRYRSDTVACLRTDYVHELQERYGTQMREADEALRTAAPAERVKLTKRLEKLRGQAAEIKEYEEKIHHLADMMIPLDLDDGVKVNYAKFGDVLAKIK